MEISKILKGGPDVLSDSKNILSRFWRLVLIRQKISPARFESLLDNYVTSLSTLVGEKAVQNVKGNLIKALESNTLTWSNIVKGLILLNIKNASLEITLVKAGLLTEYVLEIPVAEGLGSFSKLSIEDIDRVTGTLNEVTRQIVNWHDDSFAVGAEELIGTYANLQDDNRIKSKLLKSIKTGDATWKTFFLLIRALGFDKIILTFNGKVSTKLKVNLQPYYQ